MYWLSYVMDLVNMAKINKKGIKDRKFKFNHNESFSAY